MWFFPPQKDEIRGWAEYDLFVESGMERSADRRRRCYGNFLEYFGRPFHYPIRRLVVNFREVSKISWSLKSDWSFSIALKVDRRFESIAVEPAAKL